jgi:hypothetical protein
MFENGYLKALRREEHLGLVSFVASLWCVTGRNPLVFLNCWVSWVCIYSSFRCDSCLYFFDVFFPDGSSRSWSSGTSNDCLPTWSSTSASSLFLFCCWNSQRDRYLGCVSLQKLHLQLTQAECFIGLGAPHKYVYSFGFFYSLIVCVSVFTEWKEKESCLRFCRTMWKIFVQSRFLFRFFLFAFVPWVWQTPSGTLRRASAVNHPWSGFCWKFVLATAGLF